MRKPRLASFGSQGAARRPRSRAARAVSFRVRSLTVFSYRSPVAIIKRYLLCE